MNLPGKSGTPRPMLEVCTRVGPKTLARLDALALRYETTRAEQIRRAIESYLDVKPKGMRGLTHRQLGDGDGDVTD